MVIKEERSLLPTAVTSSTRVSESSRSPKQTFKWLHLAVLVLIFAWLALLSVLTARNWQIMMPQDFEGFREVRDRRQLVSDQTSTLEGDIIVRHPNAGNLTSSLDAPLANPNRLWPRGMVEYRFYGTFPMQNRRKVLQSMEYITSKVPCITFHPKNESAIDFVTIYDGATSCSSELGRVGGDQALHLSSGCFDSGLTIPVHELLHTLGFVHEHTRPDRDKFISINFDNILPGKKKNFEKRTQGNSDTSEKGEVDSKNTPYDVLSLLHYGPRDFSKNGEDVISYIHGLPDQSWPEPYDDDPLSVIDQVELSMAYHCEVSQEVLLQYVHFNRNYNTLLIQHNTELIDQLKAAVHTCGSAQIVSSTSYGCPGGPQSSDSAWCRSFPAENIFSLDVDRWNGEEGSPANYWLTENGKAGGDQSFIMYLGCTKTVKGVVLRNTHNAGYLDRSTKKFRILGSSHIDGSWQELLVANLEDSRLRHNPPPVKQLKFASPSVVSFIKFEMLEMWGGKVGANGWGGGGLQYFALI